MPKAIPCIPHVQRMETHKLEYLKAINMAINYPFQSEDGREPSDDHSALAKQCKKLTGIENWIFTNCCTDSLQIAFHTLCDPGDKVIIPAYGWRAIANAPRFMQMQVIYCDINETGNVDTDMLNQLIIDHKPKAVLVVHNFGTIVDVRKISRTAKDNNCYIIEDAAPSFTMGEQYSYKLGSASHAVCFSFDFTKSPGCLGAGGGLATNDGYLYNKFKTICSHKTKHNLIGTKSYLDTIAAAVLREDMRIIEHNRYRKRRVEIATYYLNKMPYKTLPGENYIFHRFIILPDKNKKQDLLNKLRSQKILAKSVFEPNSFDCSRAVEFYEQAIELPCHQFIDINDLNERLQRIL